MSIERDAIQEADLVEVNRVKTQQEYVAKLWFSNNALTGIKGVMCFYRTNVSQGEDKARGDRSHRVPCRLRPLRLFHERRNRKNTFKRKGRKSRKSYQRMNKLQVRVGSWST
jgi:hypothetical protein